MSFVGGKSQSGVLQRIINLIPPHEAYIEPFFGSGAVMRFKKPATVNVGIDLEPRPAGLPAWVDFRQESAFDFLERYRWTGGEFVYADPPYVLSSRKRKRACYRFEFTDDDHRRLLTMLKKLPCRVLLSGYPSNLYAGLLPDWHCERFRVMTRGHSWANECLWYNYERPETLHDDRYTGTNYRDRLRLRRKRARWVSRLQRLPDLERSMLFSALVDVMGQVRAEHEIHAPGP